MAEVVKFKTPVFRASFPNLFKAQAGPEGGEPKFGVSAIWTPGDFTEREKMLWKKLMKAVDDECKRRFKKGLKDLKALNAEGGNFKLVPRNGSTKADMEGYGDGTVFANLTTKYRPGVVGTERDEAGKPLPISPEEGNESEIYPGCYCRATVTIYSYDNKGKGIAFGLQNVQKVRDGDRLDNRSNAAEDFDDDFLDDEENLLDDGLEDDGLGLDD